MDRVLPRHGIDVSISQGRAEGPLDDEIVRDENRPAFVFPREERDPTNERTNEPAA